MTVKEFVDRFLPSNTKVKVVKSSVVAFDGNLEDWYYYGVKTFTWIVAMVGAEEDKVCLSCR